MKSEASLIDKFLSVCILKHPLVCGVECSDVLTSVVVKLIQDVESRLTQLKQVDKLLPQGYDTSEQMNQLWSDLQHNDDSECIDEYHVSQLFPYDHLQEQAQIIRSQRFGGDKVTSSSMSLVDVLVAIDSITVVRSIDAAKDVAYMSKFFAIHHLGKLLFADTDLTVHERLYLLSKMDTVTVLDADVPINFFDSFTTFKYSKMAKIALVGYVSWMLLSLMLSSKETISRRDHKQTVTMLFLKQKIISLKYAHCFKGLKIKYYTNSYHLD